MNGEGLALGWWLRVGDEYMGIHYTILSPFNVYLKFSILDFFKK